MMKDYYKQELDRLYHLGRDFSEDNPILASFLSKSTNDPDVERVLQGVAFLTAHIQQKLDDEFPEIIQSLMQAINPQYLRPIPATTMIRFQPRKNLTEKLLIKKGTAIDSHSVDNTICRFTTCYDIEAMPLEILRVDQKELKDEESRQDLIQVQIDFRLTSGLLENWKQPQLTLYLSDDHTDASNLYFVLRHYLQSLEVFSDDRANRVKLPPDSVRPNGFFDKEQLLPYPTNLFPAFWVLQEYFLFPQKFLYLDLDLSQWKTRGSGSEFSIAFICKTPPFPLPEATTKSFSLFTVPAVNLFPHPSDPIQLDQQQAEIRLKPSGAEEQILEIYSVNSVSGFDRGSGTKRSFQCIGDFKASFGQAPTYQLVYRPSIRENQTDFYLTLAYPRNEVIKDNEILTVQMTCSNGNCPDALKAGEICVPTTNTPELLTYGNLEHPTINHSPQLKEEILWDLLSGLLINANALAELGSLKALLKSCIRLDGRDKAREIANLKRIESISDLTIVQEERLFGKSIYRGQAIQLKVRAANFVSRGDMYLFGSVLDHFFASYASFNTYTALTIEDTTNWETLQWKPRLGLRPLL
jgi:type VI secretion system protein ImpG